MSTVVIEKETPHKQQHPNTTQTHNKPQQNPHTRPLCSNGEKVTRVKRYALAHLSYVLGQVIAPCSWIPAKIVKLHTPEKPSNVRVTLSQHVFFHLDIPHVRKLFFPIRSLPGTPDLHFELLSPASCLRTSASFSSNAWKTSAISKAIGPEVCLSDKNGPSSRSCAAQAHDTGPPAISQNHDVACRIICHRADGCLSSPVGQA